ncbi:porin family protein [Algibacter pectinivorans]|uniref:Outer membrane protein beta-barrel domain-containing protein n=1 Tax=Algibacter pectinivorans TaxID=870482 RepID=A0A1I1MU27_9FLAO|nr:porin family protein [Algibacter pectinivorans]SFC88871.1 Outer membrane protein beta-barrel domain-containing protein [Algibacter pectinivorans]
MKYCISILLFIGASSFCFAQDSTEKVVDSLYKEDQFYAGITYNLLGKSPDGLSQSGFSLGFHLGFIRDMPINTDRNIAIGIGLGYSANSFNQNLLISANDASGFDYSILDDSSNYSKNKFSTHLIEVPIEFRWRTSTPTEYNFWRIYTGFKVSYVFSNTTKYLGDTEDLKYNNIDDFNTLQYGFTLSAGYSTWNFHLYYALNPIFNKNATIDGVVLDTNAIKIGLMFYIL